MAIQEKALEELNQLLTSSSFRIIVLARIFKNVLSSLSVRKFIRLISGIISYCKGNRTALGEFVANDSLYVSLDMLRWRLAGLNASEPSAPAASLDAMGLDIPASQPEHKADSFPRRPGKRVVYFTNQLLDVHSRRPRYGGGERYCLMLSQLLQDLGFSVDVFQFGQEEFQGDYEGLHVRTVPFGTRYFSEFNLGATEEFYAISKEYDYCVYNLPEISAGAMRNDAISICHGIWFDHTNYRDAVQFRSKEWFGYLHKVFSNPTLWVSVDTNSINVIRSLWPDLATKMRYIPNFVDLEQFYPPDTGRDPSRLKVLFPRRSHVNRGSRILEDILRDIPHEVDITWLGEGDPMDTQLIKDLCKRDPRLSFAAARFDEMPGWYREADICVISTLACEGTSFSCLEGLASGCAVVSTNAGGLPDLIQDEYNGLLVDPFPRDIARAINRLIENPAERERLQKSARRSAESFAIRKWRQRWCDVLRSLGWLDESSASGIAGQSKD